MNELTAFSIPSFQCQNVDPYYIFEHIDEFNIEKISLDYTYSIPEYNVKFNDEDHPVTYTNSVIAKRTLSISKEYYEKHKDLIDKLIIEICKKSKLSEVSITSTALIDEKKIQVICGNSNIHGVTLGNQKDIFTLDVNTYSQLKSGNIEEIITQKVSPELEHNFDPIIFFNRYKKLVGNADYDTLSTAKTLTIQDNLTPEELDNLKYLNSNATVKINYTQSSHFIKIINHLKELNPERNIIINIKTKNHFNVNLFRHIRELKDSRNVKVSVPGEPAPIDLLTFIKYEKELIKMITPALKLSPFEKYLYAYNIAKQFKDYQENEEDKSSSRTLYQILNNNYMVCVGFSNLLGDLLDKLFIENNYYSVRVETAYDGIRPDITIIPNELTNRRTGEKREVLPSPNGHARREVHIVDPKYNIDGYYIADPTWDNELDHDSYTYALMTHDEVIGANRYIYMDTKNVHELFFAHNIEEFYQKLNLLLDKNSGKDLNFFISEMITLLKTLDVNFYKLLVEKYQVNANKTVKLPFEVQQEILSDIGTHIINKTNNLVNREQFKQAITTIYNLIYDPSYVDIDSIVEETMQYNEEKYNRRFPKRYRIDKDGNTSIELNEFNKFSSAELPEAKISL